MECFLCELDAVQECPRCGVLYCNHHGEALCARCLDPARALPSFWLYRGALAALAAVSAFALWLLLWPPADGAPGPSAPVRLERPPPLLAATPAASPEPSPAPTAPAATPAPTAPAAAPATPTATATAATPAATPTATPSPTPAPTPSPTPAPTPSPAPSPPPTAAPEPDTFNYSVQPNETFSTIVSRFVGDRNYKEFNDAIIELNGIENADLIRPGQILRIPR